VRLVFNCYFLTGEVTGITVVLLPPDGFFVVLGPPAFGYFTILFAILKRFVVSAYSISFSAWAPYIS